VYQLMTGRLPYCGPLGKTVNLLFGGEQQLMQEQRLEVQDVYTAIVTEEMDFTSPPWDTISHEASDFLVLLSLPLFTPFCSCAGNRSK
jgi:hypothetical protein